MKNSDKEMLELADGLVLQLRQETVDLICLLDVMELKDVHARYGYTSMFDMCVRRWKFSRDAANRHVRAARAVRAFPEIASWMRSGDLSLTAVSMIGPHLAKHGLELARRAVGRDLDGIDLLIAEIEPAPPKPDRVRTVAVQLLPAPAAKTVGQPEDAKAPQARVLIEDPGPQAELFEQPMEIRIQFEFEAGPEVKAMVARAKDLLFHKYPKGELRDIFAEALRSLLDDIDPALKTPALPRPPREEPTRRIPEWVKDIVRQRDGDRCACVAEDGTRCACTRGLEFDHIRPWADGGPSDDPDNVRQVCPPHNRWLAKQRFGERRFASSSPA